MAESGLFGASIQLANFNSPNLTIRDQKYWQEKRIVQTIQIDSFSDDPEIKLDADHTKNNTNK